MALINKNHPQIIEGRTGRNLIYLTITDKRIFFTKAAALVYGLKAGKYLQFINEGAEWFFYQDDNTDGFSLLEDGKKNGAVQMINASLVRMIRKSLKLSGKKKFFFAPADHNRNGAKLFEIYTHKSYEEIMKEV